MGMNLQANDNETRTNEVTDQTPCNKVENKTTANVDIDNSNEVTGETCLHSLEVTENMTENTGSSDVTEKKITQAESKSGVVESKEPTSMPTSTELAFVTEHKHEDEQKTHKVLDVEGSDPDENSEGEDLATAIWEAEQLDFRMPQELATTETTTSSIQPVLEDEIAANCEAPPGANVPIHPMVRTS